MFARHQRHAEGVRRAVKAWGLENLCKDPKYYSPVLTAVVMPEGHNADALRKMALDHFDVSLGTGLAKVAGKVFRIGHLGDTNDLTIIATLAGVEMALKLANVPHKSDGVRAAMAHFTETANVDELRNAVIPAPRAPGSIPQRTPAHAGHWIPGTSPGMTALVAPTGGR